ncbi:MAG TPA: class I SAM-dependent methyltransferase [Acidimicrobiia bacterium]
MPPVPDESWFDDLARFLGPAYLRNAFTKGTEQEIGFLVERLELTAGARVLDLGCGPGRHSLALARRGFDVVGIDRSAEFVDLARGTAEDEGLNAQFRVADVRELDRVRDTGALGTFDAVICLCQGGFGLLGGQEDTALLEGFARALRPGGRIALTAFHVAFAVRFLDPGDSFDPATGVHHERATLRDPAGAEKEFDLWTTCFTPRELRLVAIAAGFAVESICGVAPGRYGSDRPTLEHPEILLVAGRV